MRVLLSAITPLAASLPPAQAAEWPKAALTIAAPFPAGRLPGVNVPSWFGLCAPKGTARPVVGKLVRFVKATLETPDIAAKLRAVGGVAAPVTPSGCARFMIAGRAKWKDIVAAAAVKAN